MRIVQRFEQSWNFFRLCMPVHFDLISDFNPCVFQRIGVTTKRGGGSTPQLTVRTSDLHFGGGGGGGVVVVVFGFGPPVRGRDPRVML